MLTIIENSNFSKSYFSKYYGQIQFHFVFSKIRKLHRLSMLNFSKYEEQQILG